MIGRRIAAALALGVAALASGGATANWNATVSATGTSHLIGNPAAKVRLVEYISYTCPHCAAFTREGEEPIKLAYIAPGKVNLEVRHLLRDPVDLTVAVLAHCGPVSKFPQNHSAFMFGQDKWLATLTKATPAQQQRWKASGAAGRKAIASDGGLYAIMTRRGYSRTEVDRCLADDAFVKTLAETSAKDWEKPGIDSTPTFAVNGVVLPGTHTWDALSKQLDEFVRKAS
ncbi:thioredoxin domain-containing protein [Croceibacterium sp. LX-88]|jgi:protein-disulfide isomerase|uniref:Thioredoxin domain-containing protein n=1 Tax=Croceibacterium selenioxidans TaxID=2838833 RepID=A0ABS5W0E0_9SPHN|nr:thioredoxin domain-containing protein [Croceibacterium selenioxidans]MBT2133241.1 thioredoxin domain-containing protein [Croceibacterium selenioxidans]